MLIVSSADVYAPNRHRKLEIGVSIDMLSEIVSQPEVYLDATNHSPNMALAEQPIN